MPRETETPEITSRNVTGSVAKGVDYRAEAEARGRAAYEAAVAEPQPPTPAPPAWWESPTRKETR